jgi:hypothetical protein
MASHDSQRGRGRQRSPPPWACVPHERVEGVERRPCGGRRSLLIREHITARPRGARRDGCRHLPPARTCATDSPSSLPWRSWTIRAADKSRCRDGCDERVACGIVRPTDPHIGDRHSVIGTRANVVSTQIMAQYLVETVERLARECPDIHGAHDHHAFKVGCARRLAERIRRLRESRVRAEPEKAATRSQSASSNLPVLASLYTSNEIANRDLYKKIHDSKLGKGHGPATSRMSAYGHGLTAGDGIGLDPQMARSHRKLASRTA